MLYFAGIVEARLAVEGSDTKLSAGGYVYDIATQIKKEVDPRVSIVCRFANDGPGRIILESLVHERIIFDPSLVSSTYPSFLEVEDSASRNTVYSSSTAPVTVSSEEIVASLCEVSDLEFLVLCGNALYWQPLFSSLLDAATFVSPRPVLVVDSALFSYSHSEDARLKKQILQAAECADYLLLDEGELSFFEGEDLSARCRNVCIVKESGEAVLNGEPLQGSGKKAFYSWLIRTKN